LHKIPNFGFSKVAGRHITRIFLPALISEGRTTDLRVPAKLLTDFYNKCLRPAVEAVLPESATHWPVDHANALALVRDNLGQMHFGSIDVPRDRLQEFEAALLNNMDTMPEFSESFFGHELRGTKNSSRHSHELRWDREEALEDYFDFLDLDRIHTADWKLDIGLEITHPGRALQWRTDARERILQFAMPSATPRQISDVSGSRGKTHVDLSAQVAALSGFRCNPGQTGDRDGVSYINVYTTDKEATYQLHKGVFSRHRVSDALPAGLPKLVRASRKLCDVMLSCAGAGETEQFQECAARFEVRMDFSKAVDGHWNITDDFLQHCLVSYQAPAWW
ncbi:hypothetical protein BXZ70DRAFT_903076, partial [Cristinia sonorae]